MTLTFSERVEQRRAKQDLPSSGLKTQATNFRRAFSMLETSIAVAILGVGLIMVAAVFPVAISQHQASAEQAGAIELAYKADALLKARFNTTDLYVPLAPSGADSPWYLLPTMNIVAGNNDLTLGVNNWDFMAQPGTALTDPLYANLINWFGPGNGNPVVLLGLDVMSDRMAPFTTNNSLSPFTDDELMATPKHLIWYGFYRRMGTGAIRFAVAICKQRRGATYAEQDMSVIAPGLIYDTPFATPVGLFLPNRRLPDRRLPVPWRVSVGYEGGQRLSNRVTPQMLGIVAGAGLGDLAPTGSKIMIQGDSYVNPPTNPKIPIPAGRILTVSRVVDRATIEVLEDLSDLPVLFPSGVGATFDVWLFPPAVEASISGMPWKGDSASRESPLLAWRTTL